ncbi:DUF4214 domain-containing protein, partial [Massilia sp. YIM B04103]|uniref:DUF4214 domain-containing protein n=1 Tax=Massilia sp. YIM B04103 TaxID=2963106 RepID=UPI00210D9D75
RRGQLTDTVSDLGGANLSAHTDYDAFGRPEKRRDANGNVTSFGYDKLGRQVSVQLPLGPATTATYDAFDRVLTQTDANGQTTRTEYNTQQRTVTLTTPEGFKKVVRNNRYGQQIELTDGNDNTSTFEYDRNGKLLKTVNALKEEVKNAYDQAGRLWQSTDANGTVTEFTYDAANRILSKTVDPSGLKLSTKYTYDALGQVQTVTDPRGIVTRNVYDKKGQLKSVIVDDSDSKLETKFEYDGRGKTLSVTDPAGRVTVYEYDNLGRRTAEVVDPKSRNPQGLDLRTEYEYDGSGNVIARKDANQSLSRFAFDANNRLRGSIDPAGAVTLNEYDAAGRLTKTSRIAKALDLEKELRSMPQPRNTASDTAALLARVNPDASRDGVQWNIYNADGQVEYVVDGAGKVSKLEYDKNGNVTGRTGYAEKISVAGLGTAPGKDKLPALKTSGNDQRQRIVYDAANRVVATVTAQHPLVDDIQEWAVVSYAYDGNGNLVEQRSYSRAINSNVMPAKEAVLFFVSGEPSQGYGDSVKRYGYDHANRQILSATALGVDGQGTPQWAVTQQQFDESGNLLQRTEYRNAVSEAGLPAKPGAEALRNWMSGVASGDGDRITRYAYDGAGRQIAQIDAEGAVTRQEFDRSGQVTLRTQYAVALKALKRDERAIDMLGRLQANAAADRSERREFDKAGRTRFVLDAAGYIKEWRYDALGRVLSTHAYLAPAKDGGKIEKAAAARGNEARVNRFSYDAQGNVLSSTDSIGAIETFSYDALGNKKTYTNKLGNTWEYGYDAAGRLTEEVGPPVTVHDNGMVQADDWMKPRTGQVMRLKTLMEYDALGNLTKRTEAAGAAGQERSTRYEYDAAGHQVKTIRSGWRVYDAGADSGLSQNGFGGRTERDSGDLVTTVTYDIFGRAVRNVDALGNVSEKAYDNLGRVILERDAENHVTGYERDAFGDVSRLTRYSQVLSTSLLGPWTAQSQKKALLAQLNALANTEDRTIYNSYDKLGRVTRTVEPQVFVYDPNSISAEQKYLAARATTTAYDAFGGAKEKKVFGVDGAGKQLSRAAETRYAFDQRGALASEWTLTGEAGPEQGYVTLMEYDYAGNLARKVEYSDKISNWNAASGMPPQVQGKDRETRFAYDREGRKIEEIRANAEYAVGQGNATVRGEISTKYGYDAVGNLVTTIDAYGNASHSYYDSLGHVTATVGPNAQARTQVTALFLAVLRRAPSARELSDWIQELAKENGPLKMAKALLECEEGRRNYPAGQDNNGFLTTLYQSTQNRTPDAGGLQYWADVMASQNASKERIVLDIVRAVTDYNGSDPLAYGSRRWFNAQIEMVLRATMPAQDVDQYGRRAPLAELRLDAFGNVTQRIEYSNGALFANAAGYAALAQNLAADRITTTSYDAGGHAVQVVNAEGRSSFASYDKLGRIAKQWSHVTQRNTWAPNNTLNKTSFLVFGYDKLGRAVSTKEPSTTDGILERSSTYNAFGELTRRHVGGVLVEYNDYDQAGRLWRTNAGDGVSRVMLHDNAGNVTAELRSATLKLINEAYRDAQQVDGLPGLVRNETRYDVLGHVTAQIRSAQQIGSNVPSSLTESNIGVLVTGRTTYTQQEVQNPENPGNGEGPTFRWTGQNSVQLDLRGLAKLGGGDVKIEVSYGTKAVSAAESGNNAGRPASDHSYTQIFNAAQADAGPLLSWNSPGEPLDELKHIRVWKKDLSGRWSLLIDHNSAGPAGHALLVAAPADPGIKVALQYRLRGRAEWKAAEGLTNFGDTLRLDTSLLADGEYEYQVLQSGLDGGQAVVRESGTWNVSDIKARRDVTQLYVALFNRAPDAGGLQFWANAVRGGGVTPLHIATQMLEGEEGKASFPPGDSNAAFISRIYKNIFGAEVPSARAASLEGQLASRGRAQFVVDLMTEVMSDYRPGTQAVRQLFADKVEVGLAYGFKLKGSNVRSAAELLGKVAASGKDAVLAEAAVTAAREEAQRRIASLYVAIFNRAPDKGGLEFWVNDIQRGIELTTIVSGMLSGPEGQKMFAEAARGEPFLQKLYQNLLGRAPNADELKTGLGLLANTSREATALALVDLIGSYRGSDPQALAAQRMLTNKVVVGLAYAVDMQGTEPDVATALLAGVQAEATADAAARAAKTAADLMLKQAQLKQATAKAAAEAAAAADAAMPMEKKRELIARLYVALLNRAPDSDGLAKWSKALASELSAGGATDKLLGVVADSLLQSDEGRTLFAAGLSPEQFLRQLYQQAFNRKADEGGLKFWLDVLAANPKMSRGEWAANVIAGLVRERQPAGEVLDSQRLFNNKVALGLSYALSMGGNDKEAARQINALVTADDITAASAAADAAILAAVSKAARESAADTAAAADRAAADTAAGIALLQAARDRTRASDAVAASPLIDNLLKYTRLYVALFRRAPSFKEVNEASIELGGGQKLEKLVEKMLALPELQALYASSLSDEAFVRSVYANAMGRSGVSAEGMDFWVRDLQVNKNSRAAVTSGIIDGLIRGDWALDSEMAARADLLERSAKALQSAIAEGDAAVAQARANVDTTSIEAKRAKDIAAEASRKAAALTGTVNLSAAEQRLSLIRVYVAVLQRPPTLAELSHQLSQLASGVRLENIVQALLDSPAGRERFAPNLSAADFISTFYTKVLGRTPDEGGGKYWIDSMLNDGETKGKTVTRLIEAVVGNTKEHDGAMLSQKLFDQAVLDAANAVAASAAEAARQASGGKVDADKASQDAAKAAQAAREQAVRAAKARDEASNAATTRQLKVLRLALAMLGREPTLAEFNNWLAQASEKSLPALAAELGKLAEWKQQYDGLGTAALIQKFFKLVLGRDPDTGGFQYWMGRAGGLNTFELVCEMIDGLIIGTRPEEEVTDPQRLETIQLLLESQRLFNDRVSKAASTLSAAAAIAAHHASEDAVRAAGEATQTKKALTEAEAMSANALTAADAAASALKALLTAPAQATLGVVRLAVAMLGREPTGAELQAWLATYAKNGQLLDVALAMEQSATWKQGYGSLDNSSFLDAFYLKVENRNPDEGGKKYWMERLRADSRSKVLYDIVDEMVSKSSADPLVIDSKKFFNDSVDAAMRRVSAAAQSAATAASEASKESAKKLEELQRNVKLAEDTLKAAEAKAKEAVSGVDSLLKTSANDRLQIVKLYVLIHQRVPTQDEISQGMKDLAASSIEAVADKMLQSPEGQAKYPSTLTRKEFIAKVYQVAFGRLTSEGGEDGANWWLERWQQSAGYMLVHVAEGGYAYAEGITGLGLKDQSNFFSKLQSYMKAVESNAATASGKIKADLETANREIVTRNDELTAARNASQSAKTEYENVDRAGASAASEAARVTSVQSGTATAMLRLRLARLYVGAHNRHSGTTRIDLGGFEDWMRTLVRTPASEIERQLVITTGDFLAVANNYPASLTAEEFVTRFYINALGRAPDSASLEKWARVVVTPGQGRAYAVKNIIDTLVAYGDAGERDEAMAQSRQMFEGRVVSELENLSRLAETELGAKNNDAYWASRRYSEYTGVQDAERAIERAGVDKSTWKDEVSKREVRKKFADQLDQASYETKIRLAQLYVALVGRAPELEIIRDGALLQTSDMRKYANNILNHDSGEATRYLGAGLSNDAFVERFFALTLGHSDSGNWGKDALRGHGDRAQLVSDVLLNARTLGLEEGFMNRVRAALGTLINEAQEAKSFYSQAEQQVAAAQTRLEYAAIDKGAAIVERDRRYTALGDANSKATDASNAATAMRAGLAIAKADLAAAEARSKAAAKMTAWNDKKNAELVAQKAYNLAQTTVQNLKNAVETANQMALANESASRLLGSIMTAASLSNQRKSASDALDTAKNAVQLTMKAVTDGNEQLKITQAAAEVATQAALAAAAAVTSVAATAQAALAADQAKTAADKAKGAADLANKLAQDQTSSEAAAKADADAVVAAAAALVAS